MLTRLKSGLAPYFRFAALRFPDGFGRHQEAWVRARLQKIANVPERRGSGWLCRGRSLVFGFFQAEAEPVGSIGRDGNRTAPIADLRMERLQFRFSAGD